MVLGVSRPAVREALKRVAAAGLVEVRQGDATTVRDFRRHAGLDLLPRLLLHGGELDVAVARSILEARLHNGPKVAELAAERRRPDWPELLEQSIAALESADDPVEQQRHALTFWDHVVDGADSIAFRLMFNTLRAAYEPALPALATLMAAEVGQVQAYRALAAVIAAGEPAAAATAARELLEPATTALDRRPDRPGRINDDRPTGTRRGMTLAEAAREFWKHPSPWLFGGGALAAAVARIAVGDWQPTDALVPVAVAAAFPFFEWMIHVFVLHWRPRRLGRAHPRPRAGPQAPRTPHRAA